MTIMKASDIINFLIDENIYLSVTKDGNLSVKSKYGEVTKEALEIIKRNKADIVKHLSIFQSSDDGSSLFNRFQKYSLEDETQLDESIQATHLPIAKIDDPKTIFLTGVTGFIGIYLLKELIQRTRASIVCLIRADSDKKAMERLEDTINRYRVKNDIVLQRITPMHGDLSLSLFGLSSVLFNKLAQEVDVIYHSGAWVNHILPYGVLKKVNVGGTSEVLRLASSNRLKAIHHISTGAIELDKNFNRLHSTPEFGYALSKSVAEQLIYKAHERGVPTCVYRLGMISGDSTTGVSNTSDRICQLIKGCVALGCIPSADDLSTLLPTTLTTVDDTVRNIITIAKNNKFHNKGYEISSSHSVNWQELITALKEKDYNLKVLKVQEWRSILLKMAQGHPAYIYDTLLALYPEKFFKEVHVNRLKSVLINDTDDINIYYQHVNKNIMKKYIEYFISSDFL